MNLRRGFLNCD